MDSPAQPALSKTASRLESGVRLHPKVAVGFLFAFIGGLAVLIGLPLSRPLYSRVLFPSNADRELTLARQLAMGHPLPAPTEANSAALWLSIAASRAVHAADLHADELHDLQEIAKDFARLEPDNAYWSQAGATFALDSGDFGRARDLWIKASHSLSWNNHETNQLLANFDQRTPLPGSVFADLITLRNRDVLTHIQQTAKKLLSLYWNDQKWSSSVKAATVLNGDLIRSHARSLASMDAAIGIVDLSLIRPGAPTPTGHHQLLVARLDLEREVSAAKIDLGSHSLEGAFNECDSAIALTTREDTNARRVSLSTQAAIAECLPGAVLLSAGLSLVTLLFRLVFAGAQMLDRRVPWLGTGIASVAGLLLALRIVPNFVALAFALCLVFCGSSPANVRKTLPTKLGPLHDAFIALLAGLLIACGATFCLFISTASGPHLRSLLPSAFDWRASCFGLIILLFGSVFLTAPLWAFAQRLPTSAVLSTSLARLARAISVMALILAVILGPICFAVERNVQPQLLKIFVNEPIYYLSR